MMLKTAIRVALRRFASSPGFTLLSLLTLAIGIGANIAIFSIVNGVLLRPLPFPESQRLVVINHTAPGLPGLEEMPISEALYHLYRKESRALESVTVFDDGQASFTDAENPQRLKSSNVSSSFFDVLRTTPTMGRRFNPDDSVPGAAKVVIIGDSLWRGRFAADPGILGKIVQVNGESSEIVGVMPAGFAFPNRLTQLWQPEPLDEENAPLGNFSLLAMGRIADGSDLESVDAEFRGLLSTLEERFTQGAARVLSDADFAPLIKPAREFLVGDIRAALWIVLGAVGFLLLIACANVANLFLARTEGRHREVAIRFALGESRAWVMGSTMIESLLLGLSGGIIALPLAAVAVRLLVRYGPQDLPRIQQVSVDGLVVLFALVLSVVVGLLFGVVPALRAAAMAGSSNLTQGARGASASRHRNRVRQALVVAQIALALTLLIGSGLAVRSFQRLHDLNPGFDPDGTLTFRLELPERDYPEPSSRLGFQHRMIDGLKALPGVTAVAVTDELPLSGGINGSGHVLEGAEEVERPLPLVFRYKQVSPQYFQTMGIRLVEGRTLGESDEAEARYSVVVSKTLASTRWPGQSALGKGLNNGGRPEEGEPWFRVVGVVDDVYEEQLDQKPPEVVYYSMALPDGQEEVDVPSELSFVVRGPSTANLADAVRRAVRSIDPSLPIADLQGLDDLVADARASRAFVMFLLIVAAGFALLLGSVGLYGVISFVVAQRRREIAIRMAIGAHTSDIRGMVLREAAWLALAGTAIGVVGAVVLTRRLQALLFETSPLDPVVFVAVSLLLAGVCFLASWLPARRASQVAPVSALRYE